MTIPHTVVETIAKPDTTATATAVEYSTITNVRPVTVVTTVGGKERTITYTTTELIETQVPTTVHQTVERPDVTATVKDVQYKTVTNLRPVTEVVTVGGEKHTITQHETKVIQVTQPTTVYTTITGTGGTETTVEVVYKTQTSEYLVTKTVVVPGGGSTQVVQSTSTVVYSAASTVTASVTPGAPSEGSSEGAKHPAAPSQETHPTSSSPLRPTKDCDGCCPDEASSGRRSPGCVGWLHGTPLSGTIHRSVHFPHASKHNRFS